MAFHHDSWLGLLLCSLNIKMLLDAVSVIVFRVPFLLKKKSFTDAALPSIILYYTIIWKVKM